jgi:hypothetical protein
VGNGRCVVNDQVVGAVIWFPLVSLALTVAVYFTPRASAAVGVNVAVLVSLS